MRFTDFRALGYPRRTLLKQWLSEDYPEDFQHCSTDKPRVYLTQEQKVEAVHDLCTRTGSVRSVADKYGVSPCSLYIWRKKLFSEGIPMQMPKPQKHNEQKSEAEQIRELTSEAASLSAEAEYLSPMIDCYDGLPVAWAIGTSPNAELVNTMLDEAIGTLQEDGHPMVHSDRGCHYRWPSWIDWMEKAGLTRSMSKKGCSPDNSACEGFFGRLKNEMFYNHSWAGVSIKEFIEILDQYIHWYAEKRIKVSLDGLSPIEYRRIQGLVA